jgi:hypothetical protein
MADSLEKRVERLEQAESAPGTFEQKVRALLCHVARDRGQAAPSDEECAEAVRTLTPIRKHLEPELGVDGTMTLFGLELIINLRKGA